MRFETDTSSYESEALTTNRDFPDLLLTTEENHEMHQSDHS